MNSRRVTDGITAMKQSRSSTVVAKSTLLDEASFQRMITLERKRTDRSQKPFLVMLLDLGHTLPTERDGDTLRELLSALSCCTREIDLVGWYRNSEVIGLMFTELTIDEESSLLTKMVSRVSEIVRTNIGLQRFSEIGMSCYLYPEDWEGAKGLGNPMLYPDLFHRGQQQKYLRIAKRAIDIILSVMAVVALSPIFALVAFLVKITSKGPVIFRQERLGQFGKTFEFLKFRTMYADNDHKLHQEFMKKVINGKYEGQSGDDGKPVYKMTDDPRITRVGRFLRRTSLDELPQFFNVLMGDMSVVGPRPPLAYEYKEYEIWHRRRLLEVKPGITGLWQVKGRSRVSFNDMVRLDLQYVRTWSLWLDIQILLKTPRAVLFGDGAF